MELHVRNQDNSSKIATLNMEYPHVPLPKIIRVPCQRRESDCQPLVKSGDEVLRGQAVAKTEGVSVHTPVSGKVKEVVVSDNCEGIPAITVVIENNGEQDSMSLAAYETLERLGAKELYSHLQAAGIVTTYKDVEGTLVKALPAVESKIDTILLFGCSLSPDKSANIETPSLMQEVVSGIKALFVLYPEAKLVWQGEKGSPLEEILAEFPESRMMSNQSKIHSLTMGLAIEKALGHPLEDGCSPMSAGLVPLTMQQARAIHRAVFLGEPYMEQLIKVEGSGVSNPGYYQAPLGTNLEDVLVAADVDREQLAKVVVGCALNGTSVSRLDLPISKSVSSVIAFPKEEVFHYQDSPCIHCGRCYEVCHLKLLPQKIAAYAESSRWDLAKEEGVLLCNECGRCSYICPARRPLQQLIKLSKQMINKKQKN